MTALLYRPADIPSLSWDEGWGLSVAKNWVETGRYARLLQGNPISAVGMAQPFSVTGPIALSFFLFGIGIWQGRLSAMVFMTVALFLIFLLARRLFNPRLSYLVLFVLLFMAIPTIHPWILGREALAEAPMVFFLSAGFLFLLSSMNSHKQAIFGTMFFWGLALDSKGHVLPFLTISIILPLVVAFLHKQWQYVRIFGMTLLGSFSVYFLMQGIQKKLSNPYPLYDSPMKGLYSLVGFVTAPGVRLITLNNLLLYGIPTIIGLYFGIKRIAAELKSGTVLQPPFYLKLSISGLVVSWFLWFALLSIGWGRYFFPISFFGSIFIALMIEELIMQGKQLIQGKLKKALYERLKVYILLIMVVYSMTINLYSLYFQIITGDNHPSQISDYVKHSMRSDASIETYESELIFLLDNPIHYPPDQTQVNLNRKTFLGVKIDNPYDLSQVKSDYLIDGPNSKMWQLYTPLLAQGNFKLVYQAGEYQVFKKIP